MKQIILFLLISVLFLFTGCSNKKDRDIESISNDSFPAISEYYGISDGETGHDVTEEEATYHSERGIHSPEDAYLLGYDEGFEAGEEDASNGYDFRYSYDSSNDFRGYYSQSYKTGYEHGYEDAYYTHQMEDDDDDEEDNPDFYEQDFD